MNIVDEKPTFDFTFDESENDIYQKLLNMTAKEHEKIVKTEGLPFSYVINLMKEISAILSTYS